MLSAYHWPGNIRELENTIERAVIMTEGDVITREDLNLPFKMESEKWDSNSIEIPPSGINLEEVERELILKALKMKGWVQKDAAELVGISRRVLNYKIKRFGITHPKWKRNI
jgi:DNA-binding NtrC family response regulator